MVIRGGTRGNGGQLAQYLVTLKDNENIQILEVDGRTGPGANADYLNDTLLSMAIMADLTKSQKGLYHAQINPAYAEDKNMDWYKAADILGKELGLEEQRRIIVLHEKKGRTHAHVVWERYDHDTGNIKSDSFSRLAQDRARKDMEIEFGHNPTPHRNKHRPELKASLTQLWHQTGTGAQFLNACKNNGYMIAHGVGRNPFMVVDENGRSYDLVRQLKEVRLKDVRQRLRNETLMTEKAAITFMHNQKSDRDAEDAGKEKAKFNRTAQKAKIIAQEFTDSGKDKTQIKSEPIADHFDYSKRDILSEDRAHKIIAKEFTENKSDKTLNDKERLRQALAKDRQTSRDKNHDRDKGMEYD